MSLVPLLFSDWWEDLDRPHRLFDQDFGLGIHQHQLPSPSIVQLQMRPREQRLHPSLLNYYRDLLQQDGGSSTVSADKDKFQVTLDCQQFRPDEIDVKVVDKHVVVHAKHEEKKDEHGWISREFTRKYLIPEQCDLEQVVSKLSSDGVLTIAAPRKEQPKAKNEKSIKIELTGKPAMKAKEEAKSVEDKKDKK